jgi:hypothetical protein
MNIVVTLQQEITIGFNSNHSFHSNTLSLSYLSKFDINIWVPNARYSFDPKNCIDDGNGARWNMLNNEEGYH